MGTLFTVIAGLALAGATTFGLISSQSDNPAGSAPSGSSVITYNTGR